MHFQTSNAFVRIISSFVSIGIHMLAIERTQLIKKAFLFDSLSACSLESLLIAIDVFYFSFFFSCKPTSDRFITLFGAHCNKINFTGKRQASQIQLKYFFRKVFHC